ncbi:MAG TPA: dihydropteroate synthase [Actinomycetota bacterium]|nr:dihydropteroate synthase [Actinomycetota bacterium]
MSIAGRCLVMGIVNRTPDSFYDGGRMDLTESVAHAHSLRQQGADLIDIGAVKAGPGEEVPEEEELERVIPLVTEVAQFASGRISIETASPLVAEKAFEAGASVLNDVSELLDARLAKVCAQAGAGLVVMHNGGQIRGRPRHPVYEDIVATVLECWEALTTKALAAGIPRERIVVDAGLDFGKTTFHSLELVRRMDEQVATGWPVLVAPSRKDVVGETLELPPEERLEGSLALAVLAAYMGAAIVRVHDVRATARAVHMAESVSRRRSPGSPVRGLWD